MAEQKYVLEAIDISKSFSGVRVLNKVCLKIKPGEVHALMGENGAGKSTLVKIIMGVYKADSGQIKFNGQPVEIKGTRDALNLGISMIHQELSPIPEMTVAENIFLGRESTFKGTPFIKRAHLNERTKEILKKYDMDEYITPTMKMSRLNIAQIQMMEIIKAVSYDSKVIIMDEPTSSLSEKEVAILFRTIELLKKNGVGIIYISHRMEEIFDLADRVTVLRDGELIGCIEGEEITPDRLIKMMVGRELSSVYPKNTAPKGDVVLEIKNFTRKDVFENVSFNVRAGEILGLAGLVGAGRSEVVRALVGYDELDSGEVYLEGKRIHIKHPKDAKKNHIVMAPEDRKSLGLVLCRSIKENVLLQNTKLYSKASFINHKKANEVCSGITQKVSVKMNSINDTVSSLSGGNQQKVVIAKSLLSSPKVLILDEPTRGIDIGAKAEIYKMMVELANRGIAIIMISSEMQELIGMSDRIIVMSDGKITGELDRNVENLQEEILKLALGRVNNRDEQ